MCKVIAVANSKGGVEKPQVRQILDLDWQKKGRRY